MESIIFTRIKELCVENDITVNKLESELGMSQYSIGRWKNATSPTIDKISKIAKYFNVSIDYLVGATDIRTPMDTIMKAGFDFAFSDDKSRLSDT